jgi:hypothetical protein
MTSGRLRAAAITMLALLAGCGGTSTDRTSSADGTRNTMVTASPSAATGPLTANNVYDRVVAGASYPGLRGTMALKESAVNGTLDLSGPFATNLGHGNGTSDLQLTAGTNGGFSVRAIGLTLYCKVGPRPWKDYTASGPTENTAEGEQVRDVAGQLLAGLSALHFVSLIQDGTNLTTAPAPAGQFAFHAAMPIGDGGTNYAPNLFSGYAAAGITTMSYTVTFDQQGRPTALSEHLASSKLTVDYNVSITGYTAAKVTAPI